ncbi:MAG: hypothetical protein HYU66_23515 [Armatimonadetes bacterium]|nr:hypothetical protein [Armatimonadota bacterium]
MTADTSDKVLGLVKQAAREYEEAEGIDLGLEFPFAPRRDGDWYFVTVVAARRPRRSFEYYERLREIEHRLQDDPVNSVNVLLVPGVAEVV